MAELLCARSLEHFSEVQFFPAPVKTTSLSNTIFASAWITSNCDLCDLFI